MFDWLSVELYIQLAVIFLFFCCVVACTIAAHNISEDDAQSNPRIFNGAYVIMGITNVEQDAFPVILFNAILILLFWPVAAILFTYKTITHY